MAKYLLIDGFNLTFRSYYAVPELSRADGFPTNAMHGWVRAMWKLEDIEKPDAIIVFFDLEGSAARLEIFPEYKANRGETPETLIPQIPWLKEISRAMGFTVIEQAGIEADDLLGAAAVKLAKQGHDAIMVSADKDLAQCVQSGVSQLLPPPTANPKVGWRRLDEDGVEKKFGVTASQIPDYLALIGDTSDNIPGIQGVGPKTAVKWLKEYGSLEQIIAKKNYILPARFQPKIDAGQEQLKVNLQLVTLDLSHDQELPEGIKVDAQRLLGILEEMEMKTMHAQAEKRYAAVS